MKGGVEAAEPAGLWAVAAAAVQRAARKPTSMISWTPAPSTMTSDSTSQFKGLIHVLVASNQNQRSVGGTRPRARRRFSS